MGCLGYVRGGLTLDWMAAVELEEGGFDKPPGARGRDMVRGEGRSRAVVGEGSNGTERRLESRDTQAGFRDKICCTATFLGRKKKNSAEVVVVAGKGR